jgi:hypothetical protein
VKREERVSQPFRRVIVTKINKGVLHLLTAKKKITMGRHLLLSIIYFLLLTVGWLMVGIGYTIAWINWEVDMLISLSGIALIIFSIIKLVYHFPKINSNQ